MEKSDIIKAMDKQWAVKVDGHDGVFAIVEINLLLNTAGLVLLSDKDGVPSMTAKFEDVKVAEWQNKVGGHSEI